MNAVQVFSQLFVLTEGIRPCALCHRCHSSLMPGVTQETFNPKNPWAMTELCTTRCYIQWVAPYHRANGAQHLTPGIRPLCPVSRNNPSILEYSVLREPRCDAHPSSCDGSSIWYKSSGHDGCGELVHRISGDRDARSIKQFGIACKSDITRLVFKKGMVHRQNGSKCTTVLACDLGPFWRTVTRMRGMYSRGGIW